MGLDIETCGAPSLNNILFYYDIYCRIHLDFFFQNVRLDEQEIKILSGTLQALYILSRFCLKKACHYAVGL